MEKHKNQLFGADVKLDEYMKDETSRIIKAAKAEMRTVPLISTDFRMWRMLRQMRASLR